jgi:hypothetical protein
MSAPKVSHRAQGVERHLAAAAEYISIAESGDAEKTAYEHAADEIIAAQQEDSTLTLRDVDRRLGRGSDYAGRLVRWRTSAAPARQPFGGANENARKDLVHARKVARERPDAFVAAFEQAPPDAKQKIAERLSRTAEVRLEARKRDLETAKHTRPNLVPPRTDHMLYEAQSKLATAERVLREFIAIINELDQPGNDEDIIEQLARIEQLAQAAHEGYTTGKSIDTWALELWEQREVDR